MHRQWPYSYSYYPTYEGSPQSQGKQKQEKDELYDVIQQLMEKIEIMEQKQKQLQAQLESIKPITIENINYKIQDLHVEELSGNLLVGLTALSDAEELQQFLRDQMDSRDDTGENEEEMQNAEQ